jgi:hypothetical protein
MGEHCHDVVVSWFGTGLWIGYAMRCRFRGAVSPEDSATLDPGLC